VKRPILRHQLENNHARPYELVAVQFRTFFATTALAASAPAAATAIFGFDIAFSDVLRRAVGVCAPTREICVGPAVSNFEERAPSTTTRDRYGRAATLFLYY
jgi:hypothetical protein